MLLLYSFCSCAYSEQKQLSASYLLLHHHSRVNVNATWFMNFHSAETWHCNHHEPVRRLCIAFCQLTAFLDCMIAIGLTRASHAVTALKAAAALYALLSCAALSQCCGLLGSALMRMSCLQATCLCLIYAKVPLQWPKWALTAICYSVYVPLPPPGPLIWCAAFYCASFQGAEAMHVATSSSTPHCCRPNISLKLAGMIHMHPAGLGPQGPAGT